MIGSFPDPHEDELFYSVVARFSRRMRFPALTNVSMELFGNAAVRASAEAPGRLSHLANHLHNKTYSADYWIDNHTSFRLYVPFLPERRLATIRDRMKAGGNQGVNIRLGMASSGVTGIR
jgi:hypothetical protein